MIYLDYLRPIAEFNKTDDIDQPTLVLETDIGLMFYGEWNGDSGYFFVTDLLFEPETDDQIEFVSKMELPGRLYGTVTKFQYVGEI